MSSEQVNAALIYNELQLGQGLNQAVSNGQSAKFAYLLSLLSDDVLDQAQFHFTNFEQQPLSHTDDTLRRQFGLPESAPIFCNDESVRRAQQQGELLAATGSIRDIHLLNALAPVALVARGEGESTLPAEVVDLLPHWKRHGAKEETEFSHVEPMIDLLNQLNS